LELSADSLHKVLSVDVEGWLEELPLIEQHFAKFGKHLPQGMRDEVANLRRRLEAAKTSK
jgi:phosphoenolpyruvate carboxykinase (GTP)